MKSIAIYCVTYNSYAETDRFLSSVDVAAEKSNNMNVTVFVADNTEDNIQVIRTDYPNISVEPFVVGKNSGYFGAVQQCMQKHNPANYDYVVISNVDLVVNNDALKRLAEIDVTDSIGWLAPMIYSTAENRDHNPKIMSRYSKRKLHLLKFMYSHPWINRLYEHTVYRLKSSIQDVHEEGEKIYAGHGSFIILTNAFFRKAGTIDYPIFLFGEEIYLAEKCRLNRMKTIYVPSVMITDSDHCSTGKMQPSFYYKCNYESIRYILHEYY